MYEIAHLQIIAYKWKYLPLSLSIWNLFETTASSLYSKSFNTYGLLLLTGSHPGLLLKDDGSEILPQWGQFTPVLSIFSCKSRVIFI